MSLIRGVGASPTSDMFWTDADSPWEFIAACKEISNFHDEGMSFITHLPVGMDATTQGLQIYAMLLRDSVAAKATNVLPGAEPSDPYSEVADIVRQKLRADTSEYAAKWLAFGIGRKTTKRQTMTLVYGSTFFSCRAYTAEWFYDQLKSGRDNPFGDETYKPCNYLAEKIWEAISVVVSSARVCMDWLRDCARIFIEHGVVPRWCTPLGFPIKMHYENMNKYTIKTMVSGVIRQHRLRIPNSETNKRKTINAICPNLVHSLDGVGGLLGTIINRALDCGIRSVRSVHDSIAVLAPEAEDMAVCIREATVDVFDQPILENIRYQFSLMLPSGVSLPEHPPLGDLNVSDVRKSLYYWN